MPTALRNKLGPAASEGLLEMFTVRERNQQQYITHFLQDTLDSRFRIANEELRREMRESIHDSNVKMIDRIHASEDKLNGKIEGLRKETHTGFLNVQKQITSQTRWLIGVAAFLAMALKALDLIVR